VNTISKRGETRRAWGEKLATRRTGRGKGKGGRKPRRGRTDGCAR